MRPAKSLNHISTSSTDSSAIINKVFVEPTVYDDKEHEVGYQLEKPKVGDTVAIMETSEGTIKIRFFPEAAPKAVENFVTHAKDGYYNGLTFHRVIKDFMIQGGDPEGTGMGGPGYSIKGEFASNGFKNDLKHTRGVLSMARSMRPDSAGSQFFIMHQNAPHLDGDYAAFGKLIEGEDVLDKIAGVDTDYSDRPRKPQVMKTVTVETFGEEYPEPEKL